MRRRTPAPAPPSRRESRLARLCSCVRSCAADRCARRLEARLRSGKTGPVPRRLCRSKSLEYPAVAAAIHMSPDRRCGSPRRKPGPPRLTPGWRTRVNTSPAYPTEAEDRPETFRSRSATSLWVAQNVHPRVIMELLGHSQFSPTMNTYAHIMPQLRREAADRMDQFLAGLPCSRSSKASFQNVRGDRQR